MMKDYLNLQNIGLTLSIVGSIFIAEAISLPPVTGGYRAWIYTGFIILILGFFLQLKKNK